MDLIKDIININFEDVKKLKTKELLKILVILTVVHFIILMGLKVFPNGQLSSTSSSGKTCFTANGTQVPCNPEMRKHNTIRWAK